MLDIYVISTDLNTGLSRLPYPFHIHIVAHIIQAGMLSDFFLHFIIIKKHRILLLILLLTVTASLNKEMKILYTFKIQQN